MDLKITAIALGHNADNACPANSSTPPPACFARKGSMASR
jgi:hypothetical protein